MKRPKNPWTRDAGYIAAKYGYFVEWFVVYDLGRTGEEFVPLGMNAFVESKKVGERIYTPTIVMARSLMVRACDGVGFNKWNLELEAAREKGNIAISTYDRSKRY